MYYFDDRFGAVVDQSAAACRRFYPRTDQIFVWPTNSWPTNSCPVLYADCRYIGTSTNDTRLFLVKGPFINKKFTYLVQLVTFLYG